MSGRSRIVGALGALGIITLTLAGCDTTESTPLPSTSSSAPSSVPELTSTAPTPEPTTPAPVTPVPTTVQRTPAAATPPKPRTHPRPADHAPLLTPVAPGGATARCADGTYSHSAHRRGTCSHHGGVAEWL
ncbi:DUF3761 domain-containing protein [Sciscionella marina]|uniref:DUF3761 domain-containing protein n=1 Tax=Sciscionella marina TaxID=508770 RepID=UPI000A3117E3|nr:DUF3761 domain-containing protein [Sciscionella marina]